MMRNIKAYYSGKSLYSICYMCRHNVKSVCNVTRHTFALVTMQFSWFYQVCCIWKLFSYLLRKWQAEKCKDKMTSLRTPLVVNRFFWHMHVKGFHLNILKNHICICSTILSSAINVIFSLQRFIGQYPEQLSQLVAIWKYSFYFETACS